jgi:hypothetical protein
MIGLMNADAGMMIDLQGRSKVSSGSAGAGGRIWAAPLRFFTTAMARCRALGKAKKAGSWVELAMAMGVLVFLSCFVEPPDAK